MKVLVDTSVWSLALRRVSPAPSHAVDVLRTLIEDGRVAMIGPIRQELLSGVKGTAQFRKLADALDAFPDEPLGSPDYIEAAHCFNKCRTRGIQGSGTDFLLCAVSLRRDLPLLTTDKDFTAYAKVLRLQLVET